MKTQPQERLVTRSRVAKRRVNSARKSENESGEVHLRASDLKQRVQRWFEELWNQRNPAVMMELLDPAAVGETEGGKISGYRDFIEKLHSPLIGAFPDLRVTLDDVIAEGDNAAVRWTFEGTHGGDTLGIPATHRRVKVSGMSWIKCRNGRFVAGWDRWNANGLMTYLRDGTKCATIRDSSDD